MPYQSTTPPYDECFIKLHTTNICIHLWSLMIMINYRWTTTSKWSMIVVVSSYLHWGLYLIEQEFPDWMVSRRIMRTLECVWVHLLMLAKFTHFDFSSPLSSVCQLSVLTSRGPRFSINFKRNCGTLRRWHQYSGSILLLPRQGVKHLKDLLAAWMIWNGLFVLTDQVSLC
jgi:hypothetical protein